MNSEEYTAVRDDKLYIDSTDSCNCNWYKSMKLPCGHIFAARRELSLDLYIPDLCDKRWLKSYAKNVYSIFDVSERYKLFSEAETLESVPYTINERYFRILPLMEKIAAVVADSPGNEFLKKEESLKTILKLWEHDKDVAVVELQTAEENGL